MTKEFDVETFSAMQTGKPYKTYKKTILGQVYCTILDPFNNEPRGMILHGNPETEDETCMIDVWNEMQDLFFKRMNKKNLETGRLLAYERKEDSAILKPEPFADASDEVLDEVLTSKYYTITSALNKCTSSAVLFRFLNRARKLEKSEKIIDAINARISELQHGDDNEKQES